jgi:hypothetical protein
MWWKKVTFHNYFFVAFIINILSIAVILITQGLLPPVVPLYYGRPEGVAQLIQPLGLLIAPAISLLIGAINLVLNMWTGDVFLKKILAVTSLVFSVISLITIVKISLLVGFF